MSDKAIDFANKSSEPELVCMSVIPSLYLLARYGSTEHLETILITASRLLSQEKKEEE
jgi:hypothetical protein